MKPDKIDLKIIEALQKDGRMTNQRLSEVVSLSPSACLERLRRLEQGGLISGYHAEVAMEKLVPYAAVLVEITLKNHRVEDFNKFEAIVAAMPEIVECYAVGGGIDYIVKFVARSIEHYQLMIDELLAGEAGIERYFTYFITKATKKTPYPVTRFIDGSV